MIPIPFPVLPELHDPRPIGRIPGRWEHEGFVVDWKLIRRMRREPFAKEVPGLEFIGAGIDRRAFLLPDGRHVLKLSAHSDSHQFKAEFDRIKRYASQGLSNWFTVPVAKGKGWAVVPLVHYTYGRLVNKEGAKPHVGPPTDSFLRQGGTWIHNHLKLTYGIYIGDLNYYNWGLDETGTIKILDYGY